MIPIRLLTLALICSTSALAQPAQSTPDTAAPPPPPGVKIHTERPGRDIHNVQYRVIAGDGPRSDLRIAPPGMWWKNPDIVQKLTLTADQQKRMDDIFQQSRLQLIDLKANVEKQEVMLEPMLSANPPDTNKVLAQIDHVASARAELEKANAKMLLGIRGVLSADQWTKLQAEQRDNRRMMFRFQPRTPDGPHPPGGPFGPESLFKGPSHGSVGQVFELPALGMPGQIAPPFDMAMAIPGPEAPDVSVDIEQLGLD